MSAGAEPGPAAYGRGGTGADGHRRQPRPRPAQRRIVPRRRAASRRGGRDARDPRPLRRPARASTSSTAAFGIVEIANAAMASALRLMSVQRGLDPRGVRAGRVRRRRAGPRQPAGGRDGHRQDDRPAQPGHVLGARAPDERPPPRLLADVPAAHRVGRRRRRSARCSPGSRPTAGRCSVARASPTQDVADRGPRRDAVRRPELRAADRAAARWTSSRTTCRGGRAASTPPTSGRTGSPPRPSRPRSSTSGWRRSGGSRRGCRARIPDGRRAASSRRLDPPGLLRRDRRLHRRRRSTTASTFVHATVAGRAVHRRGDGFDHRRPPRLLGPSRTRWGNLVITPSGGEGPA